MSNEKPDAEPSKEQRTNAPDRDASQHKQVTEPQGPFAAMLLRQHPETD